MNGFFLVDKPSGISSAKVVSIIKKKFNIKKIGHAGTLDPLATGLLVLMVNRATKLFSLFLRENKVYEVEIKFGEGTDTYDSEGEVTSKSNNIPNLDELTLALKHFIGEIEQEVPPFSAVKRNGKSLYKLARKGEKIENLPKKHINIYNINILKYDIKNKILVLKVSCSGGTYIRSLANDLGKFLNTVAHVIKLRRTETSFFSIQNAKYLDNIEEGNLLNLRDFFYKNYNDRLVKFTDKEFLAILENKQKIAHSIIASNISETEFILYKEDLRIYL